MTTNDKTQRDSRFELLRILCIILIIMHHFSCHGGYVIDESISIFNVSFLNILIVGGKLGSNVLVLISGYYLINKEFKIKKLIKLLLQVFFYSSIIYLIFLASGEITFDVKYFIANFLPTLFNRYWFMTCYVILYIVSPLINKFIKSKSQYEHLAIILILVAIQSMLMQIGEQFVTNFCWFITLYIISAYLKRFELPKIFNNFVFNLILFVVSYGIIIIASVFLNINLWGISNIYCLISSLSLFNMFKSIKKPFNSKLINLVSSTTLGIYLIHDNKYLRPFIWQDLLKCPQMLYLQESNFVLFTIISILGVFLVCCTIDLARIYFLDKPIRKLISKIKKSRTENNSKAF